MTFKFLIFILFLSVAEIAHLLKEGIWEHKYAFGILKIVILNTIILTILLIKSFYFGVLLKIKEVMPKIIKSAAKAFMTPLKTPKKESK